MNARNEFANSCARIHEFQKVQDHFILDELIAEIASHTDDSSDRPYDLLGRMQKPYKDDCFIKVTKPGPQFLPFLERGLVQLEKLKPVKPTEEANPGEEVVADSGSESWGLASWEMGLTTLDAKFFDWKYFDEWMNDQWLKVNWKERCLYPAVRNFKFPP